MNFYFITALSFSVFIPGVIAIVMLRKIDRSYYPFLFALWLGCINELLSFVLIMNRMETLVNSNIYVLLESLLLIWFFYEAGIFKNKNAFLSLLLLLFLIWICENSILGNISRNSTYFRIISSIIVVLLSIRLINETLFGYHRDILKNANFILCICFIIYFSYKAICQSFVIYGLTKDTAFLLKIYLIMIYINLGVNLLYTLAVLWMPRKLTFILPL